MTAAKYIRLSSADEDIRMGDKAESNSVVNQRKLLDCYLESHREFSNCTILEFLDDGRSGTNFDRPGLHAMLEAARRYWLVPWEGFCLLVPPDDPVTLVACFPSGLYDQLAELARSEEPERVHPVTGS